MRKIKYKKGFIVWAYGEYWYHRTYDSAVKRATKITWCHDVQIINVETGKRV